MKTIILVAIAAQASAGLEVAFERLLRVVESGIVFALPDSRFEETMTGSGLRKNESSGAWESATAEGRLSARIAKSPSGDYAEVNLAYREPKRLNHALLDHLLRTSTTTTLDGADKVVIEVPAERTAYGGCKVKRTLTLELGTALLSSQGAAASCAKS